MCAGAREKGLGMLALLRLASATLFSETLVLAWLGTYNYVPGGLVFLQKGEYIPVFRSKGTPSSVSDIDLLIGEPGVLQGTHRL